MKRLVIFIRGLVTATNFTEKFNGFCLQLQISRLFRSILKDIQTLCHVDYFSQNFFYYVFFFFFFGFCWRPALICFRRTTTLVSEVFSFLFNFQLKSPRRKKAKKTSGNRILRSRECSQFSSTVDFFRGFVFLLLLLLFLLFFFFCFCFFFFSCL